MDQQRPPTPKEVQKHEERLKGMRERIEELTAEEEQLVGRINERFLPLAKLRAEVVANRMDQETGIKSLAIPGR